MYWSEKMINMMRVIEYINKKKYIRDTKAGRQWRVLELKEIEKEKKVPEAKGKEKEKKEGGQGPSGFSMKMKRQFRLGIVAPQEIYKFPKCNGFLLRKLFIHWVGEGDGPGAEGDMRFQAMALITLQEAAEAYVVNFFEDANLCTVHTKKVTLLPKDIQLVHRIQGIWLSTSKL